MNRCRDARTRQPERYPISEPLVGARGLVGGVDGLAKAMRVVELPPVIVEDRGPLARREGRRVGDDRLEVREGLAVRTGPGGLARRAGPDREHGLDVARLRGVVHEARALGPVLGAQGVDDVLVERSPAQLGQALLDRTARDLVAEGESLGAQLDHPRQLGGDERVDVRAQELRREPGADVGGDHRQPLERVAGLGIEASQPGQDRVGDAGRHLVGRRGQRRGDVERVASRELVQGGAIAPGARRERPHGAARERREREAVDGVAGERAQEAVQRVTGPDLLVAQGQDEHGADRLDAARRVAEHVDGRVVGPVDVLNHEDRRAALRELLHERGEDAVGRAVVGQGRGQRSLGSRGGIAQRPQGARRREIVGRCQHQAGAIVDAVGKGAHQGRLADARVARDQDRRSVAGRGVRHGVDQDVELRFSLEQAFGHGDMVM
jgi:hypothetical protein